MNRETWIIRFKDAMRPYVNDAPSKEELEEFLQTEAEYAYENVADYQDMTPEEASLETVEAIKAMQ